MQQLILLILHNIVITCILHAYPLFCNYCVAYLYHFLHTFIPQKEENQRRAQHGEPLLPVTDEAVEQELNLKPVVAPGRLDTLLIGEQVDHRCQQISEIAGAAFGKLYLAEGLQSKQ